MVPQLAGQAGINQLSLCAAVNQNTPQYSTQKERLSTCETINQTATSNTELITILVHDESARALSIVPSATNE